jgi:SAM-dependent methyltransferase
MRAFADHFSGQAAGYAEFRPRYPDALFEAIAAACRFRDRAWDCATGTGQAAGPLAAHFDAVVATDASRGQIAEATPHDRVRYGVARGEAAPLRDGSAGLVTIAQALHWLDLPVFYAEVRRVLRPGGLLVAWTYGRQRVDDGAIDRAVGDFYECVIGPYWPPERRWVETGYRTLRFPFEEVPLDPPPMSADWTLPQLLGYIGTWSAVARYRTAAGRDPLAKLADRLLPLWGATDRIRRVEWPLSVRAGR